MKSFPILDYNRRVNFLELRVIIKEKGRTFEIINWQYDNSSYEVIGYWELYNVYEYRNCGNKFLKVDNIVLSEYIKTGQKMLDCYLGEIRRLECL